MKKRTKRYDEGGSAIDETKSDVLQALTGTRYAQPKKEMAEMPSEPTPRAADQEILDAITRTAAGVRPSYDYSEMPEPAVPKAAIKKVTPKPKTPASTSSSSAEGMKNYVPRKPVYRQVTQKEMAESYVKKRRAAQDSDEGMAKGGLAAKGWGKARGARAAKIY
jgi:hypothetical protein